MVRPDSPHSYPGTLGNRPIAVQFHAGSHYVALRLLEGYLPKEKLKLVHYGSPQQRFEMVKTRLMVLVTQRCRVRLAIDQDYKIHSCFVLPQVA